MLFCNWQTHGLSSKQSRKATPGNKEFDYGVENPHFSFQWTLQNQFSVSSKRWFKSNWHWTNALSLFLHSIGKNERIIKKPAYLDNRTGIVDDNVKEITNARHEHLILSSNEQRKICHLFHFTRKKSFDWEQTMLEKLWAILFLWALKEKHPGTSGIPWDWEKNPLCCFSHQAPEMTSKIDIFKKTLLWEGIELIWSVFLWMCPSDYFDYVSYESQLVWIKK